MSGWRARAARMFGFWPQVAMLNFRDATLTLAGVWFNIQFWRATTTGRPWHAFARQKCGSRFSRHRHGLCTLQHCQEAVEALLAPKADESTDLPPPSPIPRARGWSSVMEGLPWARPWRGMLNCWWKALPREVLVLAWWIWPVLKRNVKPWSSPSHLATNC